MEGRTSSSSSSDELALHFSDDEIRRQSQSSSQTASVSDLTTEDAHSSIPTLDVEVTIDDGSRSSRCEDSDGSVLEWTKQFHTLVEEAPLLEAALVRHTSSTEKNGFYPEESFGGAGKEVEEGAQTLECDWIDPELLEEGRKFVRRNFFAVFLAHFIGVAFLLTVRPIQALLLRTSALHRKENTLRRYVKMIMFLKRFYEESPNLVTGSTSKECRNDVMIIRKLQKAAAKNFKVYVPPPWEDLKLTLEEQEIFAAVQEDAKQLSGISTNTKYLPKIIFTCNPEVALSQYSLVIIQQAFAGFVSAFPRLFGVYEKVDRNGDSKGLNGFVHLWAVLGHIFGIEERFNLCIPRNYDPDTNQLIFKQVFLFSFKTINESAMRLWRSMTAGSSRYFFFFRTKAMMYFMCRDVAQLESCKCLSSIMKPTERFCYNFYKFLIDWLLWIPPFRGLMNCSLRLSVYVCQYCVRRAKKGESKYEVPSVCVIDPALLKKELYSK